MSDHSPELSPDDCEDIALMQRVKQGDMEAFERLVERHQAKVIGTVTRMLGDIGDAEDIAQQVFVRVWNSSGRYEPSARFTTWVFTITRNLAFNELRRRKRRLATAHEGGTLEEGAYQIPDSHGKLPSHHLEEQETAAAIQRAIDALPPMQRMAVILRRYEDVSYEEIGRILELSVPAVKSVLFRARAELRERLKDFLEGE